VAKQSKAKVCGQSLAGVEGSNPTRGMDPVYYYYFLVIFYLHVMMVCWWLFDQPKPVTNSNNVVVKKCNCILLLLLLNNGVELLKDLLEPLKVPNTMKEKGIKIHAVAS
jgi:hypothetical protein